MDEPLQYLGPAPATRAPGPAALPASAAVAVGPLLSYSSSFGPASAPTASALAPAHLDSYPLLAVAMATASAIQRSPCLNYFITVNQRPTLSPSSATANHPASTLLKKYTDLGFPAAVGPAWPLDTINSAIYTDPHASTLKPETTAFCQQELLERVQNGFSIILPVDVVMLMFGDHIRISRLESVVQANRKLCLICNYYAVPDDVTPAVNAYTEKSTVPRPPEE